jgi:hypothetical protein
MEGVAQAFKNKKPSPVSGEIGRRDVKTYRLFRKRSEPRKGYKYQKLNEQLLHIISIKVLVTPYENSFN